MAEAGFEPASAALNEGGGGMAYFDTDKIGGLMIELDALPPHLSDDYYWGTCPWQATLPCSRRKKPNAPVTRSPTPVEDLW